MKVLLAIDSSTASQNVVNEAAVRPWPPGTTLFVISIVDMDSRKGIPALIEDAKFAAKALVKAAAGKLTGSGYEVSSEVHLGFPRKAIPEYAEQWGADLIMVGSHGQSALTRLLLGSVAQAVLRDALCSVEIVRSSSEGSPAFYHPMKILFATDGSDCSTLAAYSVANRPWPAGSQIKVISVRELLTLENQISPSSRGPVYPEGLLNEVLEAARKHAEDAADNARQTLKAAGLKVCDHQAMPVGDARTVLLDEASAWCADLIVLGSHGRHGFDRMLLGSVSESVALHAHCSVQVIRRWPVAR